MRKIGLLVLVLFLIACPVYAKLKVKVTKLKNIETKNIKDFASARKTKLPIVLKLGSVNCPPCRYMEPIMKELAVEQNGKVVFLDLDVYENRDLARAHSVRVIPTIVFFDKTGKVQDRREGAMSKEDLLKRIKELKFIP